MSKAVVASFCEVFQKSYGFIRKLVTAVLASWKNQTFIDIFKKYWQITILGSGY